MDKAVKLINEDGVGVIPTDTVYGLAASASSPVAVARLYAFKEREKKPGTVLAASIEQLVVLGIKKRYLRAVESFWPGPISIVIPCSDNLSYLHLGLHGLAVRIPKDENILKILRQTGPLITTSANKTGMPTATNIKQTKEYFGSSLDFYVDGGELKGKASTIIKVIDDEVVVLRQGSEIIP